MRIAYITVNTQIYERDWSIVHRVEYPHPGEPDFYRAVTSLDCFRNRELNKWHAQYVRGHGVARGFKHAIVTYARDVDHMWEQVLELHKSTFVDHKSVWDFYAAVGYDYKKQKWN